MSTVVQPPEPVRPEPRRLYTYDEVLAQYPETNTPCELRDGELIASPRPSFLHQEISLRFYRALFDWVSKERLGKVVAAPIDMVLSPHEVTQPDVVYISQARLGIVQRIIMGPVDLAAEVISLGTRNRDRIEKRDLYEQYGVQEYWIIDPEATTVEVLFLAHQQYELAERRRAGETASSRLLAGFQVSVDYLLRGES